MSLEALFSEDSRLRSILVQLHCIDYIALFHNLCEKGYHFDFSEVRELQKIASYYISRLHEKPCLKPREQARPKRRYNDKEELAFVVSTMNIKPKSAYEKYLAAGFKRKKQAFNMLRYWVRDNF